MVNHSQQDRPTGMVIVIILTCGKKKSRLAGKFLGTNKNTSVPKKNIMAKPDINTFDEKYISPNKHTSTGKRKKIQYI